MNEFLQYLVHALLIGIGATAVMDIWALLLKRGFNISSLDYAMVGRWLGHIARGKWQHVSIGKAPAIASERLLGWSAHYAIGCVFAACLLAIMGLGWARQPTLLPALLFGVLSVAAPFFILQPGLGAGIAASKTPQPNIARLRSLMTHTVFGVGLYVAAWLVAKLLSPSS